MIPTRWVICPLIVCLLTGAGQASAQSRSSEVTTAANAGGGAIGPHDVRLIDGGRARAVVITADQPNPIAILAVQELLEHIKLATGVDLDVVTESAAPAPGRIARIFVGETRAAATAGINTTTLDYDAFVLRVRGGDVYIVGRENNKEYNRNSMLNGTLYGVYEVIERTLGVRWLWPGELGRHVPSTDHVTIATTHETVRVAFKGRNYRIEHYTGSRGALNDYTPEIARWAFSPEALTRYSNDLQTYLRRHRMGHSEPRDLMSTPHIFTGWWERYGQQHPDWFRMDADGNRVGPTLNVSNPQLVRFIVESEKTVVKVGDIKNYRLGEVDKRVYCESPESMAMDEPLPEGWPTQGYNRVTSNRYARFAKAVRDLVHERNPGTTDRITFYIYFNFFHAPTIAIDLKGTQGVFCPWFSGFNPWYPMPEDEHQRIMDTWSGWRKTGADLYYRPNYLLTGYVMPHLSTRQTGEMFRHAAANGNQSVDFDSLWAHWAVKGPMYYLHMRLTTDPTREIDEVLSEYYESFGPAAPAVKAYFDYWEAYSANQAKRGGVDGNKVEKTRHLYPAESFSAARDLLAKAQLDAGKHPNPVYTERVAFLDIGLRHAELTAEFIRTLRSGNKTPTDNKQIAAARQALKNLLSFRRKHEHLYFADLVAAARVENRGLQVNELFDDNFALNDDQLTQYEQPWEQWHFRRDPQDRGEAENWHKADSRTPVLKGGAAS